MRVRIDRILAKYYDIGLNKYVVFCRIKVGKEWKYERLFFSTLEEANQAKDGGIVEL